MKMLFLIWAMLCGLVVYGKDSRQLTGIISDEKGEALSFANVFLYRSADSSLYKAAAADVEGKFRIEELEENRYYLKISAVGYADFFSPAFVINGQNNHVAFDGIVLQPSAQLLNAVQVAAKKPFIEQQIDKMVVNVENSISGSGSTALEVLEKVPGIIVDRQNDQIRIRNKSGVVVMIDGKINYMSSEALSQYLNNLPSDQIESIEVITNPSSKYDAAGNSGIINIRLKKNKSHGTNGTLSVSGGSGILAHSTPDLYRGSGNLSLNHRNKKWNLFGNANVGRNRFYSDNTIFRTTAFENVVSEFDQYAQRAGGGMFYSLRGGADYFLNDRTTVGVQGDYNLWRGSMTSDGRSNIRETRGGEVVESYLLPTSDRSMDNQNFSANLSLRHKFNREGKEMSFDGDYSGFRSGASQRFLNTYYSMLTLPDSTTRQRMDQPSTIDIYSGKLDFVLPTAHKMKYEFGAKSSYVTTDNDFTFENFVDGTWANDAGKTNHFKYTEMVNALYVNTGYKWEKWAVQGGLRLEHTYSDGHSITSSERNKRNYLNLFPTLFVNQTINEENSIRYSYSKRIDRPNYEQLNPFLFFLDPYTYEVGNPFLQPQFTDSYEVTYTLKNTYSLALAYADTRGMIFQVLEQNDETRSTYQTNRNLKGMQNYAVNLSVPVNPFRWWSMQNNFSVYYNHYKDADLAGASLNAGRVAYNFYTGNTFTLKNNWSGELSIWYNSPSLYGIIEMVKPQYAVNAGIQKSFLNKKARLKLSVSDIFLTSFFAGRINYSNMNLELDNRWNARRVALTFTYNFGNQNVKSLRRNSGNDEFKRRAGGNEG